MSGDQIFATLRAARRIWAVASIHGEADRLRALHQALGARFLYGDRLVYLGNILGRGARVRETVDEVLAFRRALLAQPGELGAALGEDLVLVLPRVLVPRRLGLVGLRHFILTACGSR